MTGSAASTMLGTPRRQLRSKSPRKDELKTATIREFDGGWNVIDSDLNLSSKFSKILENIYRSNDGANSVRYGTKLFGDISVQLATTGSLGTDPMTTITITKVIQLGLVTETDAAPSMIARIGSGTQLGVAKEVDKAPSISPTRLIVLNVAAEADTAPTMTIQKSFNKVILGLPSETDSAPSITPFLVKAKVRVKQVAHGLISGHTITLAGLAATRGLLAVDINTLHTVTVIDVDNYNIFVDGVASSSGTGGGSTGTFSHDNKTLSSDIINMWYFQDRKVIATANGSVLEMSSDGVTRIIFNTAIAEKLLGAPKAWSATSFVSFTVFGGQLIICNGVDKPLIADFRPKAPTQPVQYLVDVATGSNLNVPIARYVLAVDHYVLMAGDPTDVGLVHISNFETSGTWLGDPAPNDATTVQTSKIVQSTNFTIRGLSWHRDRVVVAFDDNVVLGQLNIFDANNNHTPNFSDVIEQHGSISHRALQPLGNDLLMCDTVGVPSIARALFTGTIRPDRTSELIDPEIQKALLGLSVGSTEDRVFAIYNQVERQYMLFIPNADTIGGTTETLCFVYNAIPAIKLKAWALFKGWNWSSSCRSALNRVFFSTGNKVFVYGSQTDKFYGDFINDPSITDPTKGDPVKFVWELPWADFDKRMNSKKTMYIGFDTTGTSVFTAKMFVDNLRTDPLVPATLTPTLSLQFVGGDSPGFGGGAQPYGGGRRTLEERLWKWPAKFKIAKLRFEGSSTDPLAFVAVTLGYHDGSIRR